MRIVFVDNVLLESKDATYRSRNGAYRFDLQPHLGLISLIAVAESAGHVCHLYDPKLSLARGSLELDAALYDAAAAEILALAPEVVGFTALGCNFVCVLQIASRLKAHQPDLPILLGGPHATILHYEIMERFPQFDAIARNEAEATLLPLLDALPLRQFDGLVGVTARQGTRIVVNPDTPIITDLDALPWAAYQHYPIEELNLTSLRIEAGRGCPFSCTFCSTASFFGRRYRLKSADRLVAELDYLHGKYGISHFSLTHDMFTANRHKVREFCDTVDGHGYTWTCSARMDCVNAELLERMYQAGCRSIYYGVETGSPRMQGIVQKRLDLALVAPTLDATRATGMAATASFITGYPEEQQADQDDTLDLIGTCMRRYPRGVITQLHLLTPEPGTKLFADFADVLAYDGHISDFNFPTLSPDDAAIMEHHPHVFMNHHYFLAALPRPQHLFVTSIYRVLYKLTFPVLGHLLGFYAGRLSQFVSRLYRWYQRQRGERPLDLALVRDFLADEWGSPHYLVSLVRYMAAVSDLTSRRAEKHDALPEAEIPEEGFTASPADRYYALSTNAVLLRDLHDCPAIIDRLTGGDSLTGDPLTGDDLPVAQRTERGNYLLFLADQRSLTVKNFVLDELGTALLNYLAVPRSVADCLHQLPPAAESERAVHAFLGELSRLGALSARDRFSYAADSAHPGLSAATMPTPAQRPPAERLSAYYALATEAGACP